MNDAPYRLRFILPPIHSHQAKTYQLNTVWPAFGGKLNKVRIVHSKTKPRTIHLPIASKHLELWLQDYLIRNYQSFLFSITYEGLRMMLHRVAKRVLNKRVTSHILRHSSATYYTNLLNHQQLCYRYGWSMASDMPNRYIDREGIFEEETRHVVQAHDLATLRSRIRV